MGGLELLQGTLRVFSEIGGLVARGAGSAMDGGHEVSVGIQIFLERHDIRSPVARRKIAEEGICRGRGSDPPHSRCRSEGRKHRSQGIKLRLESGDVRR